MASQGQPYTQVDPAGVTRRDEPGVTKKHFVPICYY
jgi:hypothetical protein